MKNILILMFLLISFDVFSQEISETDKRLNQCAVEYLKSKITTENDKKVYKILDEILSKISLSSNYYVVECPGLNNACAFMIDNTRFITYDWEYLKNAETKGKSYWAIIGVLAHELGHHMNGHFSSKGKEQISYRQELEADEFAGQVMGMMGASLEEATSKLDNGRSEFWTDTHPDKISRVAHLEAGWKKAKETANKNADISNYNKTNYPLDADCATKKTGNYCFINNSKNTVTVDCIGMHITIEPGDTQCYFGFQKDIYYGFKIYQGESVNMRQYPKTGNFQIIPCENQFYKIK